MPPRTPRPTKPESLVSIDGRVVTNSRALISVHDWALRYGWGAFETIRVSRQCPLFLDRHLRRFSACARVLLFDAWDETAWWHREVGRVVDRFGHAEAALNLIWTRGAAPAFEGRRIMVIRSVERPARRNGRVWVAPWRLEPTAPCVGLKTLAYLPNMFAAAAARAAGCDDAILLNTRGRIVDGAQASVFAIEGGRLLTPGVKEGALEGITREILLEVAKAAGIPVKRLAITVARLQKTDGVFLTSALRGLSIVRAVDNVPVGLKPGARRMIEILRRGYRRHVAANIASNQ